MENDHSHNGSQTGIRRTASGALDTGHYHRRARAERAEFLRAVLACLARGGWRAWGCIQARLDGQATRRELSLLSTRELKDIGLAHGDLDALATGAYFNDATRNPQSRARLRRCA